MFASVASQFMSVIDEANGEVKMDVLIKNLKMPIGERKVVLILKSDGEVSVYEDKHGLVRFTDAVELPEHGDLIERSKVHEAITQAYCLEDVPSIIDQLVPTVLEAST